MNTKNIVKSLFLFTFFPFSLALAAENGLWIEGKDRPTERVNVGIKAVTPDAYSKIAEKLDATVVNISTTQVVKSDRQRGMMPKRNNPHSQNPFDDFFGGDPFEFFFRQPPEPQQEQRRQSLGSGFILNDQGYIATNNHVVEKADEIKVILSDETEYVGKVIGRDSKTDVALIKIEPKKKLTSVMFGDSDQLKVGDIVVAIGNPFGLSHSVTQGIVSAKERSIGFGNYDDFIQTDASINPGNSGGPLLNLQGEVVGINAAIVASAQGIGFAIPVNLAKNILLKLKDGGKVTRGWIGVGIQPIGEEHATALKLAGRAGALVSDVKKDSPAQKAGIQVGDVITKFGDKNIQKVGDLPISVANTPVKKKVPVEVIRDGKLKALDVEVGEFKDDDQEESVSKGDSADPLGLSVADLTPDIRKRFRAEEDVAGVVVTAVEGSSAAASKGILAGDIILEVDQKRTPNIAAYQAATAGKKKGSTVLLLIKRGPGSIFIAFTL